MIDQIPVNVMICDPIDLKIYYYNKTSREILSRLQHLLPVAADKLIGQTIDIFHKHPQHQRKLLADPKNLPHQAKIKLDSETLDLRVSGIFSSTGANTGIMLTWSVAARYALLTESF